MIPLRRRLEGRAELMDEPGAERPVLEECLRDLAALNRRFGADRLLLGHLEELLSGFSGQARFLDAATGYGDHPRAIVRWARERGRAVEVTALDRHELTLAIARDASDGFPEIRWVRGDALALPFAAGSFDVAVSSLTLHHLEGDGPERFLRELGRVARRGVVVVDLRRGLLPWIATWAAVRCFSRNRFIRHDGPLSVRRAFRPGEALGLCARAGLAGARAVRHWPFRMALVAAKTTP